jgi:hypothetical protein
LASKVGWRDLKSIRDIETAYLNVLKKKKFRRKYLSKKKLPYGDINYKLS